MLTVHRSRRSATRACAFFARSYATETSSSSSHTHDVPPPHSSSSSTTTKTSSQQRIRLYPKPRPAVSHQHSPLPKLPPSFGSNQLLPVSNSTRALLESIVAKFDAPIRYAFAYGSGVFEQDGYAQTKDAGGEKPMLDFMFAVTHPAHFHSINMQQFPGHYPLHSRLLGSSYVSRVQDIGPGVWFNAYVPINGVMIKYGVTTVDNLCADLLNWRTLYLAGRMHKPLRIIKDDARVRLTQQVNLTSALRCALLSLPASFTEVELFEKIAGISYMGDPRMVLPAENRGKVGNIVRKQREQFRELYQRLAGALPGVTWRGAGSEMVEQDVEAKARTAHLRKLPKELLGRVKEGYMRQDAALAQLVTDDEFAFWVKLAGDEQLPQIIEREVSGIVRRPATIQSVKGIVTSGLGKSVKYSAAKIGKYWKGS